MTCTAGVPASCTTCVPARLYRFLTTAPFCLLLIASPALAIPLQFSPATPTIGDLVTIKIGNAQLKGGDIEVVERKPDRVVVRSMRPGDHRVAFVLPSDPKREYAFNLHIRSVLTPDDRLQPAPLKPPREIPRRQSADIAVGLSALVAFVLWSFVLFMKRSEPARVVERPRMSPEAEFLLAISRVKGRVDRAAAIELADATREYLSRVDARFHRELTSTELLEELRQAEEVRSRVARVLYSGDLAKFAPWEVGFDTAVVDAAEPLPALLNRGGA